MNSYMCLENVESVLAVAMNSYGEMYKKETWINNAPMPELTPEPEELVVDPE